MIDRQLSDNALNRAVVDARQPLAEDELSPNGARATAILQRVLAADVAAPHAQRRSRPRRRSSRWLAPTDDRRLRPVFVAVSLLAAAAVALVLADGFAGSGSTGTQVADAAVVHRVAAVLKPKPGTILVQRIRVLDRSRNSTRRADRFRSYEFEYVNETPEGRGPQNSLFVTSEPLGGPQETAQIGGDSEIYLRSTKTVYIASTWGADIADRGAAGDYVLTIRSGQVPVRLSLTAVQANALQDGTDQVLIVPHPHSPGHVRLQLVPATPAPTPVTTTRALLAKHQLHVAGTATVDGRPAIKLVAAHGSKTLYVDPQTYEPIKQIIDRGTKNQSSQTWTEYRTLPITSANQRLLSPAARHPTAKIDRDRQHYERASRGNTS